jgi:transcriptional regulator
MGAMYIPREFQVSLPLAQQILARYDFATLVTVDENGPFASHLPFLYRPGEGALGTLSAHLAKANPQWKSFSPPGEILAIFQGPHAYVSPSWYSAHPSVPTWNYVVVHARGIARPITDEAKVRKLLEDLVAKHDATWTMELPDDYLRGMMKQIVAFDIEVTRLEGKFKLSQNRSKEDQRSVQRELARSDDPLAQELANVMGSLQEDPKPPGPPP